ncbi:putative helicase mov-10-B.1 [Clupea harengus]|uniref:RNA helicase n=1 Tax=Clupea harengus TaxID=7950 RepID=A0A6P3W7V5_CLUHA|nr:putative helicase mov-10-B.1 [Clupea harengus]
MPALRALLETGLDFVEFLGERKSETNRKQLKDIFNKEFKRDGAKDPQFSSVVYALQKFNKATIKQDKIFLNVKPQVRVYYCDQWRRPAKPGGNAADSGASAAPSAPPPTHTASPPMANPVLTPKKKLAKEVVHKLKVNRAKLIADKGGIQISSDPVATGGKVHLNIQHIEKVFIVKFHIQSTGTKSIYFNYYTALHRIRCFTLVDEKRVTRISPLLLCPGDSYVVEVHYQLNHYGHFPASMYFEFCADPPTSSKPFCIVRELEAVAMTQLAVDLGPVAPYCPKQVAKLRARNTVVEEGEPPESSVHHSLKYIVKLKDYSYPRYLKDLANQRLEDSEYLSPAARQQLPLVRAVLDSPLCMKSYARCFHLLLYLEEIQMEVDIKKYDMHRQTMTQDKSNKKLLILKVPGVAENRPSVLRGDYLKASKTDDMTQPLTVYKGYVHRVELDSVKLGFSKKLLQSFVSNMKFDVEFTVNRFPLKLQHRAVELAAQHQLGDVLFPTGSPGTHKPSPRLRMSNQDLECNPEQNAAIQRILVGASKPAPYLVFGPPGTGKTVTLVEAINQIIRSHPSAHIVACAPSNSASDLLCERLLGHVDGNQLYRLYASSRDPRTVPPKLLKHSNWDERQDSFVFPARDTLMKYKVIAATLVTTGRLVSGGIPVGHFTHIFVDEAGQAVEPECIIGIAGLLHPQKGQLVLAGDPEQLGPILRSPLALRHGLGLSLLERLMRDNPLYQKSTDTYQYDGHFVTKLLRNYRSHPAILKVPNELFYDNELQVFANKMDREAFCNWEHLPKKGFPVVFHGVMGKDEREANSPSFFNVTEVETLISYLTKLKLTQGKRGIPKLTSKDIGIIAPYRKQVEKIQKALRSVKDLNQWSDIKVGSVEEFQGQERLVVMVSTVRSSINYVKMDQDFNIGFLTNVKRFNVAMTRSKSLLVVVGNPVILKKNPTWERFIQYCEEEGGYTGFDYSDAEGEEDVVTRLAALNINLESDEMEESAVQQQVHPEWRSEH